MIDIFPLPSFCAERACNTTKMRHKVARLTEGAL